MYTIQVIYSLTLAYPVVLSLWVHLILWEVQTLDRSDCRHPKPAIRKPWKRSRLWPDTHSFRTLPWRSDASDLKAPIFSFRGHFLHPKKRKENQNQKNKPCVALERGHVSTRWQRRLIHQLRPLTTRDSEQGPSLEFTLLCTDFTVRFGGTDPGLWAIGAESRG